MTSPTGLQDSVGTLCVVIETIRKSSKERGSRDSAEFGVYDNALRRAIVSRAYYSVFHHARFLLIEVGVDWRDFQRQNRGSEHSAVWATMSAGLFALKNHRSASQLFSEISTLGRELHGHRKIADYELGSDLLLGHSAARKRSELIIAKIAELRNILLEENLVTQPMDWIGFELDSET